MWLNNLKFFNILFIGIFLILNDFKYKECKYYSTNIKYSNKILKKKAIKIERFNENYQHLVYINLSAIKLSKIYFSKNRTFSVIFVCDYFIKMYPNLENIENIFFIRAKSYFMLLQKKMPIFAILNVTVLKNILNVRLAIKTYLSKFPNGNFVEESFIFLKNIEFRLNYYNSYIGIQYLNKKHIGASLIRFNFVNAFFLKKYIKLLIMYRY